MSVRSCRVLAGLFAVASAALLVGGGATSVSAGPIAPPVTGTEDTATFVVQDPGVSGATAMLTAYADFGSVPGTTASDFSGWVRCDDGKDRDLQVTLVYKGGPYQRSAYFDTMLPRDLIGHQCKLDVWASHGRHIWFEAPTSDTAPGKTRTLIRGAVVFQSETGGL